MLEKVMIQDIEALPIKIKLPKCKPFVAVTWYRPEGTVEVFRKFETLISRIDTTNVECILMGDSNCDFIRPSNGTNHLKDRFDTYSLTQIIDEPTRTTQDTKTLIDHIATNRPELASDRASSHVASVIIMLCTWSEKQNCQKLKFSLKLLQQEILKILTKCNLGGRWIMFHLIILGMYPPM